MTFRRRAGKAVIVLPNGERAVERREALIDNAMVKLVARGHRWHRKLFDGTHASIADVAKSENINPSFVSRILRVAYLSPTIVEAILNGQFPEHLTMKDLIAPFPMERSGGGRWNIFSAAVAQFKTADPGLASCQPPTEACANLRALF